MQEYITDFMVIDDDPMNNLICRKLLELNFPGTVINIFLHGIDGVNKMRTDYQGNDKRLIVFLDINMPELNGWDVLDKFLEFPDNLRERVTIFMLSSSVCPIDRQKIAGYDFIAGFISKPLTTATLQIVAPYLIKHSLRAAS